ncbi:hypothetical protein GCM10023194_79690 [Planotetraspora phitsanulokensis]|uniref:Zinc transporter ZupT n=1 Tax=Planotetraspora phitsanulokensis TaxID=575192 RepID=A0A8J3UBF7_9ACTN|nr:hypothetical protein [Planotetraspora phitsanulokensis]GII41702.1 hypothetical protein Pph01_67050 [Planotetraspora phitsanulokensis]
MPSADWTRAVATMVPPVSERTWTAVLLVGVSTVAGAWLARRNSRRLTAWLAITSALMLVTALADLLPDAWSDAVACGVPLWAVGLAAAFGFLMITHHNRRSCACDLEITQPRAAEHAPGRHRRVRGVVGAAVFGGLETAAALTLHRAIEGATLALNATLIVVIALMVHSASEGLALAALLDVGGQRLTPWLVVACVSPAVGVLAATLSPLPGQVVPILLGMVTGVAVRTAIAGMHHAASRHERAIVSKRHLDVAAAIVVTGGVVLVGAYGVRTHREHDDHAAASASGTPTAAPTSTPAATASPMTRADLGTAVASGRMSLADVLRDDGGVAGRVGVLWVLRHLPDYGSARAAALLAAAGVDRRSQVDDLDSRERSALIKAFPRSTTVPGRRP